METPGEDSGFGYEDPSNPVEEGSENVSYGQIPVADETDEGIEINPFLSQADNQQNQMQQFELAQAEHFLEMAGGGNQDEGQLIGDGGMPAPRGIIPPHIQLQMAQQEYQFIDGNRGNVGIAHDQENFVFENQNNLNEEVLMQQMQDAGGPPGDDNNNDRPDDVNNNTTDPNLRQQQQLIMEQQLHQQQQQIQQQLQDELQQQLESELIEQQRQQQEEQRQQSSGVGDSVSDVNEDSSSNQVGMVTSNGDSSDPKDKRKKKKKKKKNRNEGVNIGDGIKLEGGLGAKKETDDQDENDQPGEAVVEVEYVAEKLELSVFDPMYRAFANVFENFRISDLSSRKNLEEELKLKQEADAAVNLKKVPKIDLDDDDLEKKEDEKPKLSKRKLKKLTRLSVADLKQVVPRPDVVEMHDVTAKDPKLLVHLKAYRNTVPVPRHWCYKRKYLQGKRGIEKPPFDLPGFIKKTGIMEMRAALAEKEDQKSLKTKMRERIRPKMGKIDIDYQKLHDAFFKWQTKPKMTIHGDLYYEGKEFETRMKDKKPGELSDDLRTALGMPIGPNANKVPPPWLIAMQRYGPPPSYPHLKIPGLNAPIPESCSFGYHAGGWGKPPVDEFGRPLYGDVFGVMTNDPLGVNEEEYIEKGRWGELESEEEEESSEEEEEEEEKEDEEPSESAEESGLQTPAEGMATPSGFSSVPAGLETPELIELRKRRIEQDMEGGDTPAALYTVLPEKRVDRISGAMMASTHVYDLGVAKEKSKPYGIKDSSAVELALDPSELDMVDTAAMEARYEQTLKEKQAYNQGEDLSDMVAEHTAKQKNKRKRQMQQQDVKKGAKKQKEFKF